MLGSETWRSFDGKTMPWRPHPVPAGARTRAVLITIHGLSGAASDFWMLDEALPRRGIAVCGLELRGMGNDPEAGRRGDVASASAWQRDLLTFHDLIRAEHPGAPVYWYGESLGSLVALHAFADRKRKGEGDALPAGLIVSSPIAGYRAKPSPLKHFAIRTAMVLTPWRRVDIERLAGIRDEDVRVTTDTTHQSRMAVTPHYVPEFTLRLLRGIMRLAHSRPRALEELQCPLLVLASPNDVISSPEQVREYFAGAASRDKTLLWYDRSHHLLLHDVQREEVLRDVTGWLETEVSRKGLAPRPGRH